jgi:exodeoxyribonuclease V alpha subunit
MNEPAFSSPREVLAGLVERVTFHNSDNGFCVVRIQARGHRDVITVVGHAAVIAAGEWVTASGSAKMKRYLEIAGILKHDET